jgi:hypothetical protein
MIRIVEEDYIDFLFDYFSNKTTIKEKLMYPFPNAGFNMSICKFYNNKYLVSIRNVIPFTCLYNNHKIEPGLVLPLKMTDESNKIRDKYFIDSDFSEYVVLDWDSTIETSIFFVCDLDVNTLKLKVDKNVIPYIRYNTFYTFPIDEPYKKKINNYQHMFRQEDYRLFFENGRCYSYDSYINEIYQISLLNNKYLKFYKKYEHICNYRFSNNNVIEDGDYKKVYEKNWTLLNIEFEKEKNKFKETIFHFVHDFEKDGLYGVNFYPQKNKCKKVLLIPYKNNIIPIDSTCDNCRLSIGSTSTKISKDVFVFVGHMKINFIKDIDSNNINKSNINKNKNNEYFKKLGETIHFSFRKKYGANYKPHFRYLYSIFFVYLDLNKKILKMSDFYFPIPDFKYNFTLSFPMSIIKVNKDFIISSGYGNYTNYLIKLSDKDFMETFKYQINDDNFDIKNVKVKLVK